MTTSQAGLLPSGIPISVASRCWVRFHTQFLPISGFIYLYTVLWCLFRRWDIKEKRCFGDMFCGFGEASGLMRRLPPLIHACLGLYCPSLRLKTAFERSERRRKKKKRLADIVSIPNQQKLNKLVTTTHCHHLCSTNCWGLFNVLVPCNRVSIDLKLRWRFAQAFWICGLSS